MNKLSQIVHEWSMGQSATMLDNMNRLGIIDTGRLFRSLRFKIGYNRFVTDDPDRVSFQFPRYGIFVEHGVGKGRPITAPIGTGAGQRNPRNWFSETLDRRSGTELLADKLASEQADLAVKLIRISKLDTNE
jgi:hypothetical protein